jgi:hypothetical protein
MKVLAKYIAFICFSIPFLLSCGGGDNENSPITIEKKAEIERSRRQKDEESFRKEAVNLQSTYHADSLLVPPMFTYQLRNYLSRLANPIYCEGKIIDVDYRDSLYLLSINLNEERDLYNYRSNWFGENSFEFPKRYTVVELTIDEETFSSLRDSLISVHFTGTVGAVFTINDILISEMVDITSSCAEDGGEQPAHRERVKRLILRGEFVDCVLKRRAEEE